MNPVLAAQNLRKYFGEVRAVDGVDLHIGEGEVVSIIGPNGAGKTTLVNLISGFLPPDAGEIQFRDQDITLLPSTKRIRAGIARSFQLVNLFDNLTVLENIILPVLSRHRKTTRMTAPVERHRDVIKEAQETLELFGLQEKAAVPAKGLAQGERKLLDVAIAYALRPKLLLLDEPTSGVSTREKTSIMDRISAAARQGNVSLVIVEHDMDIVFNYSDRVVVMHEGNVIANGPPQEVKDNQQVKTALLGVMT